MKILVIEHNHEMRRLLKSMINEIADEVYETSGGDETATLYQSVRPDWVVIDIFREPENGLNDAASIREIDPDANIVFVSNYTDDRTRQWAKTAGGKAFFGKDDLVNLVDFLRNERGDR